MRGSAETFTDSCETSRDANCAQQGMAPLHWAARGGHTECVRALVGGGASVNIISMEVGCSFTNHPSYSISSPLTSNA